MCMCVVQLPSISSILICVFGCVSFIFCFLQGPVCHSECSDGKETWPKGNLVMRRKLGPNVLEDVKTDESEALHFA